MCEKSGKDGWEGCVKWVGRMCEMSGKNEWEGCVK